MDYREIPSSTIIGINQVDGEGKPLLDGEGNPIVKKYLVRKFGYGSVVLEEHLIPFPEEKIIRTFNETGAEDLSKQKTEPIGVTAEEI